MRNRGGNRSFPLFLSQPRTEYGSAPRSNRQQAPEQHDGVDAFPALRRPIDIGKIKPKSKLVQRQRGAHTIKDRKQPAPKDGRRGGEGSGLIQVSVADAQQDQDAPNQVVDVAATHGDVLEWPDMVLDENNQQADSQESDKEADRRQQIPAVRAVWNRLVEDEPQVGQMEQ